MFAMYVIVANVIMYGYKETTPPTPMMGWKRDLRDMSARVFLRGVLLGCGYYYIKFEGKIDKRARVLVSNHASNTDGFILSAIVGDIVPFGKIEIARMPVLGALIRLQQSILVDRTKADSRSQTLNEMIRRATSSDPWAPLMLFPEGTRTNGTSLITFKRGAFSCGAAPLQPLTIKYPFRFLNNSTSSLVVNETQLLVRMMCEVYNYAEVTALPLHIPDATQTDDVFVYSEIVRQKMSQSMGVPLSQYSFEDTILLKKILKEDKKIDFSNVRVDDYRKVHGASVKELMEIVSSFIALDGSRTGSLSVEEFIASMDLEEKSARQAFSKLDSKKEGGVCLNDFINGVFMSMKEESDLPSELSWMGVVVNERKKERNVRSTPLPSP